MKNNNFYIEMSQDITSYEFYTHILPRRKEIEYGSNSVILDFSRTYRIEPLVIPNLLCLGYELKIKSGNVPKIFFPDTSYAGEVKNYLNEKDFIHYAKKYGLYEIKVGRPH